eukprot:Opistho-2@18675
MMPSLMFVPKLLPEGLVFLLVLLVGDLLDHFKGLANKLLANDLEELVLLQGLTGHVQREIVRVDNAGHKVEVLGEHLLKLVRDEHTADIHLDVRCCLVVVHEKVGPRLLRHKQNRAEADLALRRKVDVRHRVLGVLRESLVKAVVLVLIDVLSRASPQGLVLVHQLPVVRGLLNLARLLLFLVLILHLGLLIRLLLCIRLLRLDLLLDLLRLARVQVDREVDKLRVLADEVPQGLLLEEVLRLVLQEEADRRATIQRVAPGIIDNAEALRVRLPDVLFVVGVLGRHHDRVRHKESRVKKPTPNWPIRLPVSALPSCTACKNSDVPDFAIVPRFFTRSSRVMPTPVSVMCSTLFFLSAWILIESSPRSPYFSLSVRERKRILSSASDAFEMSSRRKISLFL